MGRLRRSPDAIMNGGEGAAPIGARVDRRESHAEAESAKLAARSRGSIRLSRKILLAADVQPDRHPPRI